MTNDRPMLIPDLTDQNRIVGLVLARKTTDPHDGMVLAEHYYALHLDKSRDRMEFHHDEAMMIDFPFHSTDRREAIAFARDGKAK